MGDECTAYVVGFMFDRDLDHVALIRKLKPAWQCGKLNGVGGHIEDGELPEQAMEREFREETGVHIDHWRYVANASGDTINNGSKAKLYVFACIGDLSLLKSVTPEQIEIVATCDISVHDCPITMIENLPWLIAFAIDALEDGRPAFANVLYP